MSPVSPVFHTVVTVILTLWVFFHIRGTRVVETQFKTANPDPYPIQQWKTDLGMLVVLSTSQFHYIHKQSNLCNISSKLCFQLWKGVLSGNKTHDRHFGANSVNMCFCLILPQFSCFFFGLHTPNAGLNILPYLTKLFRRLQIYEFPFFWPLCDALLYAVCPLIDS